MDIAIANLKLYKPVYVGFSVLDLSTLLMYSFHYDTMPKNYENTDLCLTDTDTLLYEIETDNIFAETRKETHKYDFSDYPVNQSNYSVKYKKTIGKFKEELNYWISCKMLFAFIQRRGKE